MPKRARVSKVEKWIKEGRGSGVGGCPNLLPFQFEDH